MPLADGNRVKFASALQALALAAAGLWVYWPALGGDWVWDDSAEVVNNPELRSPLGLIKAWVSPSGADYFPFKTSVQWLEWQIWGDARGGYHCMSLGLHLLAALLFWRLLGRIGVKAAWLGGLLLVVHPVAVESVAWVAEMKNTLSLVFFLLSALAYLRWSALAPTRDWTAPAGERAEAGAPPLGSSDKHNPRQSGAYALSFALFALAMLSKSTVAMFPVVLLMFAWWKRGQIARRDVVASAPFFAVSLALGLVTVWFQHDRAIAGVDLGIGGLVSRLEGAGLAVAFYLWKFVAPVGLMPIYPRWSLVPPSLVQFWPWLGLAGLAGWLWTKRAGWGRGALFGLGFFGVNLLPVLGLVPMSFLLLSWVADHFAYLPMLGLIGIAVGAWGWLAERLQGSARWVLGGAAAAACAALAIASRGQAENYRDNEAFWSHALRANPRSWTADNELGQVYFNSGRLPEAIDRLEAAVELRPEYATGHNNLGNALARSGRPGEAIGEFELAIQLDPRLVGPHSTLGNLLLQSQQYSRAIEEFTAALKLRPDFPEVHNNLGVALLQSDQLPEAIDHFKEALRLQPGYPDALRNLVAVLHYLGRDAEAQAALDRNGRP